MFKSFFLNYVKYFPKYKKNVGQKETKIGVRSNPIVSKTSAKISLAWQKPVQNKYVMAKTCANIIMS